MSNYFGESLVEDHQLVSSFLTLNSYKDILFFEYDEVHSSRFTNFLKVNLKPIYYMYFPDRLIFLLINGFKNKFSV